MGARFSVLSDESPWVTQEGFTKRIEEDYRGSSSANTRQKPGQQLQVNSIDGRREERMLRPRFARDLSNASGNHHSVLCIHLS